jgi:hypothetical protein
VKPGILCLLLLSGCLSVEGSRTLYGYGLTWTCLSPEGCEGMAELQRIDRMECERADCHVTSTQDESFDEEAKLINSDLLPEACAWVYFLSLLGNELERSRICFLPGGFELDLSIPNEDPATQSLWLVEGRDLDLL